MNPETNKEIQDLKNQIKDLRNQIEKDQILKKNELLKFIEYYKQMKSTYLNIFISDCDIIDRFISSVTEK
jgi:hypothetical protein